MGKLLAMGVLVTASCCLAGCGAKMQLPEDPLVYEQKVDSEEGYAYLSYGDNAFVPYCPYEMEYMGGCIGYCDVPADGCTEGTRTYVFELKGYPSDEWIIEFLDEDCAEGMILRERNATDIPEGLSSEYEWN